MSDGIEAAMRVATSLNQRQIDVGSASSDGRRSLDMFVRSGSLAELDERQMTPAFEV